MREAFADQSLKLGLMIGRKCRQPRRRRNDQAGIPAGLIPAISPTSRDLPRRSRSPRISGRRIARHPICRVTRSKMPNQNLHTLTGSIRVTPPTPTRSKNEDRLTWAALNAFVGRHGGWVTSPPGKLLRIETMKGSALPSRLRELGYNVAERGSTTRVTGARASNPVTERATEATPSAFCEMDVIEITLSGK